MLQNFLGIVHIKSGSLEACTASESSEPLNYPKNGGGVRPLRQLEVSRELVVQKHLLGLV